MMKPQKSYSDKDLLEIHPTKGAMSLCTDDEPIRVIIRLPEAKEKHTHWAWWDADGQEFRMIYRSKGQLQMCHPYGMTAAEDHCEGVGVKVVVEEITSCSK